MADSLEKEQYGRGFKFNGAEYDDGDAFAVVSVPISRSTMGRLLTQTEFRIVVYDREYDETKAHKVEWKVIHSLCPPLARHLRASAAQVVSTLRPIAADNLIRPVDPTSGLVHVISREKEAA